jgi:hypothetical protein
MPMARPPDLPTHASRPLRSRCWPLSPSRPPAPHLPPSPTPRHNRGFLAGFDAMGRALGMLSQVGGGRGRDGRRLAANPGTCTPRACPAPLVRAPALNPPTPPHTHTHPHPQGLLLYGLQGAGKWSWRIYNAFGAYCAAFVLCVLIFGGLVDTPASLAQRAKLQTAREALQILRWVAGRVGCGHATGARATPGVWDADRLRSSTNAASSCQLLACLPPLPLRRPQQPLLPGKGAPRGPPPPPPPCTARVLSLPPNPEPQHPLPDPPQPPKTAPPRASRRRRSLRRCWRSAPRPPSSRRVRRLLAVLTPASRPAASSSLPCWRLQPSGLLTPPPAHPRPPPPGPRRAVAPLPAPPARHPLPQRHPKPHGAWAGGPWGPGACPR